MMLVKNRKSFRDGELIKQCAVKMAQVFGEEKVARKFVCHYLIIQFQEE